MSPEVAAFLLDLLSRQTLSAGADDLEQVTALIIAARRDLMEMASPAVAIPRPAAPPANDG